MQQRHVAAIEHYPHRNVSVLTKARMDNLKLDFRYGFVMFPFMSDLI